MEMKRKSKPEDKEKRKKCREKLGPKQGGGGRTSCRESLCLQCFPEFLL